MHTQMCIHLHPPPFKNIKAVRLAVTIKSDRESDLTIKSDTVMENLTCG